MTHLFTASYIRLQDVLQDPPIDMMRWWLVLAILGLTGTTLRAQQPVPATPSDSDSLAAHHKAARMEPVRTVAPRKIRYPRAAPAVSTSLLSYGTLSAAPALVEGDLLRTVQLLPGVMSRNDFDVGYDVRGGESDQNLIRLDGIPLYNPFHLGGIFGTFIDDAVGNATFMTGALPAQYGGRLSSVLDVASAEDPRPAVHGTVGVSLLAGHSVLGGAIPHMRGSWGVAARRTYADAVVSRVSKRVLPYHFFDTQLHAVDTLPTDTRLSLTLYHNRDVLDGSADQVDPFNSQSWSDSANAGDGRVHMDWDNLGAGLSLSHTLATGTISGDSLTMLQRAYISHFSTTFDIGGADRRVRNSVQETGLSGAVTRYQGGHATTIGYDYSQLSVRFRAAQQPADVGLASRYQTPVATALFAEDIWNVNDRLQLRPGLRMEQVDAAHWSGISPRLSLRYLLHDGVAITVGGGQYAQWMHALLKEDEPIRIFNYWIASDRDIPVSTAQDFVAGLEFWPSAHRHIRIELFRKRYINLTEVSPTADPNDVAHAFLRLDGESHGADFLLQELQAGPYSGWLSYSYTLSSRSNGSISYPPAQDRRHELDAVAQYRSASGWRLSAHLGYGSGTPYTNVVAEVAGRFYDPTINGWSPSINPIGFDPINGSRNASRYPTYQRLDLSASRQFHVRGTTVTPSLELINAYNYHNVFTYEFDYASSPPTRTALSQFPFFPAVGVTVTF